MKGEQILEETKLRGVVFDLDGVIIDSHPAHKRAWRDFLCSLGRQISEGDLEFVLQGRKREEILRFFLGDLEPGELALFGQRKDEFFQKVADDVPSIRGVVRFIENLAGAGIMCAVATSAGSRRTQLALDRLLIAQHFPVVVTGDDVVNGKPDPAIYRLAVEKMQLPASSMIAFEDAASGIRAAEGAGLGCVGVAAGDETANALREAGAELIIPDFTDFRLETFAHFRKTIAEVLHA